LWLVPLFCCLAACELVQFSFIHGIMDGPAINVQINNNITMHNVTPGTVVPYTRVETIPFTVGNVTVEVISVQLLNAETGGKFMPVGLLYQDIASSGSGYLTLSGIYHNISGDRSLSWYSEGYNDHNILSQSPNSASFRAMYCGPTPGSYVRLEMLLGLDHYFESRLKPLEHAFYSSILSGEYTANIYDGDTSSLLHSLNITLLAGKSYSLVITGNATVTEYTAPITATLLEYTPLPQPPPTEPKGERTLPLNTVLYAGAGVVVGVALLVYIVMKAAGFRRRGETYDKI